MDACIKHKTKHRGVCHAPNFPRPSFRPMSKSLSDQILPLFCWLGGLWMGRWGRQRSGTQGCCARCCCGRPTTPTNQPQAGSQSTSHTTTYGSGAVCASPSEAGGGESFLLAAAASPADCVWVEVGDGVGLRKGGASGTGKFDRWTGPGRSPRTLMGPADPCWLRGMFSKGVVDGLGRVRVSRARGKVTEAAAATTARPRRQGRRVADQITACTHPCPPSRRATTTTTWAAGAGGAAAVAAGGDRSSR